MSGLPSCNAATSLLPAPLVLDIADSQLFGKDWELVKRHLREAVNDQQKQLECSRLVLRSYIANFDKLMHGLSGEETVALFRSMIRRIIPVRYFALLLRLAQRRTAKENIILFKVVLDRLLEDDLLFSLIFGRIYHANMYELMHGLSHEASVRLFRRMLSLVATDDEWAEISKALHGMTFKERVNYFKFTLGKFIEVMEEEERERVKGK